MKINIPNKKFGVWVDSKNIKGFRGIREASRYAKEKSLSPDTGGKSYVYRLYKRKEWRAVAGYVSGKRIYV
jgi:hypothetical protein